jgi:potassium-transporting ATPase KdpC subunit
MKTIVTSIRILLVLTVLTGIVYPLVITGVAQLVFPERANGSLVYVNHEPVGSTLVGQAFVSDRYFWPRPSAVNYNPLPSSGSNLGPTSAALRDSVMARAARFSAPVDIVPADLLLASGSGLDPDISPEAAIFQVDRVLKARCVNQSDHSQIDSLVRAHIEMSQFGLFGEPRVNVLKLNLALDSLLP